MDILSCQLLAFFFGGGDFRVQGSSYFVFIGQASQEKSRWSVDPRDGFIYRWSVDPRDGFIHRWSVDHPEDFFTENYRWSVNRLTCFFCEFYRWSVDHPDGFFCDFYRWSVDHPKVFFAKNTVDALIRWSLWRFFWQNSVDPLITRMAFLLKFNIYRSILKASQNERTSEKRKWRARENHLAERSGQFGGKFFLNFASSNTNLENLNKLPHKQ